jgi:hypothetical protein
MITMMANTIKVGMKYQIDTKLAKKDQKLYFFNDPLDFFFYLMSFEGHMRLESRGLAMAILNILSLKILNS